jgi:hypothetical protein
MISILTFFALYLSLDTFLSKALAGSNQLLIIKSILGLALVGMLGQKLLKPVVENAAEVPV